MDASTIAAALKFYRVTDGEDVGTYHYSYEPTTIGADNIIINGEGLFTIKRKALDSFNGADNNKITLALNNPVYFINSSTQLKPTAADITISVDLAANSQDGALVAGTDFEITNYGANNSIGATAGTITIEGKGNYSGTLDLDFEIKGVNLATQAAPSYTGAALVYNGAAQEPAAADFTITGLTAGTHYKVKAGSYQNNTKAGTASVVLEGIGNYSGEVTATFPIAKLAVNETTAPFTFTLGAAPEFTGSAVGPNFTSLTVGGVALTADDYTLSSLGTNAGNYTAKLNFTADGNFSGATQDVAYIINKRDFNDGKVAVAWTTLNEGVPVVDYPYDNKDIKPAFAVTFTFGADHKYTLTSADYDAAYKDATGGTDLKGVQDGKQLIITGKRNFNAQSLTALIYNVKKRDLNVVAQDLTVGQGSEVAPVATYNSFASGESVSTFGGSQAFKYQNKSTAMEFTQAEIVDAPKGEYWIIPITDGFTETAKMANYTITATTPYGTLSKISGQVIVQLRNNTIDYGDPMPTISAFDFVHVSGLSTANSTGPNFRNILTAKGAIDPSKYTFVNAVTTPADANATGYDVTYNGGFIANDEYTITVLPGKLFVNKKLLDPTMVSIPNKTYEGKAIYPDVTITPGTGDPTLVDGKMPTNKYSVVYDANYNAGPRTAQITVPADNPNYTTAHSEWEDTDEDGIGDTWVDYTYIEKPYTIDKINVTITADNYTGENAWTYGNPEPAYTAKLTAGTPVAGEEDVIFNNFVVKRTSASTWGDHPGALQPQYNYPGAPSNYNVMLVKGDLTINKGKIIAKVKDVNLPYGEVADATTFHLEAVSGMDPAEAANFDEIVSYQHAVDKFGYVAADKKNIAEYTITYAGTTPTATNYDVEVTGTGKLNVVKRPVKFVANDKTIDYANIATWDPAVNDTYVNQVTDANYLPLIEDATMAGLIESVEATSMNVGDNEIVLTPKASSIYDITVVPGTLTITSTGVNDLTLNRVAKASYDDAHSNTAAKLIHENDGKFVNVKFSDFAMIGEKWYPLVLPFETSVKEISKVFGYAIVDTFEGTTADGKIKFKINMGTIPANTPFIFKVYENMNMSDVKFENVKIEEGEGEPIIGNAADVQFVGTYTSKVDGFRSNEYYFSSDASYNEYYKGNDENQTYLRPLGAYFVDNSADAVATSRVILIEEPNGTVTEINSIAADGSLQESNGWYSVNGVKMNGAPTQKGIYIHNGKKVVVK